MIIKGTLRNNPDVIPCVTKLTSNRQDSKNQQIGSFKVFFLTFFLGGQLRTQAPLSLSRCSGQFLTQVAPYAYLPRGLVSQLYVMGL